MRQSLGVPGHFPLGYIPESKEGLLCQTLDGTVISKADMRAASSCTLHDGQTVSDLRQFDLGFLTLQFCESDTHSVGTILQVLHFYLFPGQRHAVLFLR